MFSKVAVAAFVLPLFVQSAVAQNCARTYTVQAGDYCDKISAANNVSTYQLGAVNPGAWNTDCSNMQPGSSICLGYEGQDCQNTYIVQAKDTCDTVSSAHGINATVLYGNNPQINPACSNIYVGEVLCVAGDVNAPPAPSGALPTTIPSTATAAVSAIPSTTAAPTIPSTTAAPATTSAAASVTTSAAASATGDSGDDSDDDLPYCDEL